MAVREQETGKANRSRVSVVFEAPESIPSMTPRSVGSGVPRSVGSGVPRSLGSDVPRSLGSGVPRSVGSGVPRSLGSDVPRSLGSGVPRSVGSGVPRSLGSGVPRSHGSGIFPLISPRSASGAGDNRQNSHLLFEDKARGRRSTVASTEASRHSNKRISFLRKVWSRSRNSIVADAEESRSEDVSLQWATAKAVVKGTNQVLNERKNLVSQMISVVDESYYLHKLKAGVQQDILRSFEGLPPDVEKHLTGLISSLSKFDVEDHDDLGRLVSAALTDLTFSAQHLQELRDRLLNRMYELSATYERVDADWTNSIEDFIRQVQQIRDQFEADKQSGNIQIVRAHTEGFEIDHPPARKLSKICNKGSLTEGDSAMLRRTAVRSPSKTNLDDSSESSSDSSSDTSNDSEACASILENELKGSRSGTHQSELNVLPEVRQVFEAPIPDLKTESALAQALKAVKESRNNLVVQAVQPKVFNLSTNIPRSPRRISAQTSKNEAQPAPTAVIEEAESRLLTFRPQTAPDQTKVFGSLVVVGQSKASGKEILPARATGVQCFHQRQPTPASKDVTLAAIATFPAIHVVSRSPTSSTQLSGSRPCTVGSLDSISTPRGIRGKMRPNGGRVTLLQANNSFDNTDHFKMSGDDMTAMASNRVTRSGPPCFLRGMSWQESQPQNSERQF